MSSTSDGDGANVLGPPRGMMRSPKLPSVIRRHAAANAANGRVTALRTSTASRIAIAKNATINPASTMLRQPGPVEIIDAGVPRRCQVFVLRVEQFSDTVELGLAALGVALSTTARVPGVTLAISGSAYVARQLAAACSIASRSAIASAR